MNHETALHRRILDQYSDMPRGERRLADVLLEDATAAIDNSATQLAARAGVSKATTARFFKRLGYASFRTAQREARRHGIGPTPKAYGERVVLGSPAQPELSHHLQSEVQSLVRTIEQQRSDDIARAVRLMGRAEKLWVVGFGDNYPLAHFARAQLIKVRSDIRMLPIAGFSMPEEFASLTERDVMLALGVARRTRSLRQVVQGAREIGAPVVFITDSTSPSLPDAAGVMLRCRITASSLFESPTAAVSLITYLCSSLASWLGETTISRLRTIDEVHRSWGDLDDYDV